MKEPIYPTPDQRLSVPANQQPINRMASGDQLPANAQPLVEAVKRFSSADPYPSSNEFIPEIVKVAIMQPRRKSQLKTPISYRLVAGTGGLAALAMTTLALETNLLAYGAIAVALGVSAWGLWPWLTERFRLAYSYQEFGTDELVDLVNDWKAKRDIKSIDEFRDLLCAGELDAFLLQRSGKVERLNADQLRFFRADHGRVPLLNANWIEWRTVNHRPIPRGEIWVDIGDRRSKFQISSKSLIEEKSDKAFEAKVEWIVMHAAKLPKPPKGLANQIRLIKLLRKHREKGLSKIIEDSFELQLDAGDVIVRSLWSGNYPDFETALQKLPLETMD